MNIIWFVMYCAGIWIMAYDLYSAFKIDRNGLKYVYELAMVIDVIIIVVFVYRILEIIGIA